LILQIPFIDTTKLPNLTDFKLSETWVFVIIIVVLCVYVALKAMVAAGILEKGGSI